MSDLMFTCVFGSFGGLSGMVQPSVNAEEELLVSCTASEPVLWGTALPGVPPLTPVPAVMGAGSRCCSALLGLPASPGCLILFIFSLFKVIQAL